MMHLVGPLNLLSDWLTHRRAPTISSSVTLCCWCLLLCCSSSWSLCVCLGWVHCILS